MTNNEDRLMYLEQQQAELRRVAASMTNEQRSASIFDLALLPINIVAGVLCFTLELVLEKRQWEQQIQMEAQSLEERILDATARAQSGEIIPLPQLLEVKERG